MLKGFQLGRAVIRPAFQHYPLWLQMENRCEGHAWKLGDYEFVEIRRKLIGGGY